MPALDTPIHHVSDTSIWVAYYRAQESARPDALFQDPLAQVLIGERGHSIAQGMVALGRYVSWSVVMRTLIIDAYIQAAVHAGIDTVINLGAGLDTRPYRLKLPNHLRWIEVDYPNVIAHKNETLKAEVPSCQLRRVELDLADDTKRRVFLSQIGQESQQALVLTEGVIPYLSEEQVAALAQDLWQQPHFKYWITEFFHPEVYPVLKGRLRSQKMRHAPFQFFPRDWLGFFEGQGWTPKEIRYAGEESLKHRRALPMPWWAAFLRFFANKAVIERSKKMTGYMLLERRVK